MLNIPVPTNPTDRKSLAQVLLSIISTAISANVTVTLTVSGSDIKIVTGGTGLILTSRNGQHTGRLILENPDANGNLVLSVDTLT